MATVNTVLGPIDANLIGETMSHVHLIVRDKANSAL
jgi:predicted metal-dependent phosphotriesterase family hydrolase